MEQQVVDHGLVLQCEPGDSFGQGEVEVEIDDRQELCLASPYPAGLGQRLALGAMAVAAGVVGGALEAAVGIVTALEMASQSRGATQDQGSQHGLLHQRQGGPIDFEEGGAKTAHHFGDFQNRFGHQAPPGQERGAGGSESSGLVVEASVAVVTWV